jgi:hypothetical protein
MKNYMLIVLVLFSGQILFGADSDKWQSLRDCNMLSKGEDVYTNAALTNYNQQDLIQTRIGYVDLNLVDRTRDQRECLPVKDFPEGNWGQATNDVQVSLRFDKQSYTNQEPITTIVMVRNFGSKDFEFYDSECISRDALPGPATFFTYDQSDQPLVAQKPEHLSLRLGGGGLNVINPGTQFKFFDKLNRAYALTNGCYYVEASITAYHLLDTNTQPCKISFYQIKSARVPLEIRQP